MLSGKQKRYLRALANDLNSTFQIGKEGLSDNLLSGISDYLKANGSLNTIYNIINHIPYSALLCTYARAQCRSAAIPALREAANFYLWRNEAIPPHQSRRNGRTRLGRGRRHHHFRGRLRGPPLLRTRRRFKAFGT